MNRVSAMGALRLSGISGQRPPDTAPSTISEQLSMPGGSGQLIAGVLSMLLYARGQAAFLFLVH